MQAVLLVIQFLLSFALVAVILLQRTAQDGGGLMGGGGGTMGGLFTARGSANLLTRATAVLATAFIINSLALGFIASHMHQGNRLVQEMTAPAPSVPTAPPVPQGATTAAPPNPGEPGATVPVAPSTSTAPAVPTMPAKPVLPKAVVPAQVPEVPTAH